MLHWSSGKKLEPLKLRNTRLSNPVHNRGDALFNKDVVMYCGVKLDLFLFFIYSSSNVTHGQ